MDVFDTAADHARTLSTLPSTWDVVVSDFRGYDPAQRSLFPGIASWFDASSAHLTGQKGFAGFPKPVPYSPGEHWQLSIPPTAHRFPGAGPRIAVLPAGVRGQASDSADSSSRSGCQAPSTGGYAGRSTANTSSGPSR